MLVRWLWYFQGLLEIPGLWDFPMKEQEGEGIIHRATDSVTSPAVVYDHPTGTTNPGNKPLLVSALSSLALPRLRSCFSFPFTHHPWSVWCAMSLWSRCCFGSNIHWTGTWCCFCSGPKLVVLSLENRDGRRRKRLKKKEKIPPSLLWQNFMLTLKQVSNSAIFCVVSFKLTSLFLWLVGASSCCGARSWPCTEVFWEQRREWKSPWLWKRGSGFETNLSAIGQRKTRYFFLFLFVCVCLPGTHCLYQIHATATH